jgi:hypothetical protein
MSTRYADIGELDVAVINTVATHLFADIANVDARKQGEGSTSVRVYLLIMPHGRTWYHVVVQQTF